jgi:hypothetical protein
MLAAGLVGDWWRSLQLARVKIEGVLWVFCKTQTPTELLGTNALRTPSCMCVLRLQWGTKDEVK